MCEDVKLQGHIWPFACCLSIFPSLQCAKMLGQEDGTSSVAASTWLFPYLSLCSDMAQYGAALCRVLYIWTARLFLGGDICPGKPSLHVQMCACVGGGGEGAGFAYGLKRVGITIYHPSIPFSPCIGACVRACVRSFSMPFS